MDILIPPLSRFPVTLWPVPQPLSEAGGLPSPHPACIGGRGLAVGSRRHLSGCAYFTFFYA